jgi:hypothetical protein
VTPFFSITTLIRRLTLLPVVVLVAIAASGVSSQQSEAPLAPTQFKVGERLTYAVSFGIYQTAAYAETYVVSRGNLSGNDAVEIQGRMKTLSVLSAAKYMLDEERTTYVSAASGMPLFIRRSDLTFGLPREKTFDHLTVPSVGHDLLSLIFRIRQLGGNGSATLVEDGRDYNVNFSVSGTENVSLSSGDFSSSIVAVQSEYLTQRGITDLRINLSSDGDRVPVLIRFRIDRNEFRATLSSIQMIDPTPRVDGTPTPEPIVRPSPTPRPVPTPTPYIDDQALSTGLAFQLGETLEYRILIGGQTLGTADLRAVSRRQFKGQDSLLIAGRVTSVGPGGALLFAKNDFIRAQVDPETLSPHEFEISISGTLAENNQLAIFDPRSSFITLGGTNRIDAPVGTHSLISLLYAMRSFNLVPDAVSTNPVNDTRVAMLWRNETVVFSLRPGQIEAIDLEGRKVPAQAITINTGRPQIDQLGMRVWLGVDERRLPLRIVIGQFQFDLTSDRIESPR